GSCCRIQKHNGWSQGGTHCTHNTNKRSTGPPEWSKTDRSNTGWAGYSHPTASAGGSPKTSRFTRHSTSASNRLWHNSVTTGGYHQIKRSSNNYLKQDMRTNWMKSDW